MTVANYFQPESLEESLALLAQHGPDLLVIAGGTVAMPLINDGLSFPTQVMGLRRVGLDRIERAGAQLHIGAMSTLTSLVEQRDVPLLADAARHTASWAIRNMGTVGGNLFTPPPGGDIATALLALDAKVVSASVRGTRTIALRDFYTGFMTNSLAPDELVTQIIVPIDAGRTHFVKFGRRHANTPAVVTVAVHADFDGDRISACRVALGSAGPHPQRNRAAEEAITGRTLDDSTINAAAEGAAASCAPVPDAIASEWYRRRMVGLFVGRALRELQA